MGGIFDKLDQKRDQEQREAAARRDRHDAMLYLVSKLIAVYGPILKSYEAELIQRGYTIDRFFNSHYFTWTLTAPGGHTLSLSVYVTMAATRLCADIDGQLREANLIERVQGRNEAKHGGEKVG
jgi:hypothetical protein